MSKHPDTDNSRDKARPDKAKPEKAHAGRSLPYPDSDLSPALQRTIKRKLDAGEDEAVDREAFEEAIRRVVRQRGD